MTCFDIVSYKAQSKNNHLDTIKAFNEILELNLPFGWDDWNLNFSFLTEKESEFIQISEILQKYNIQSFYFVNTYTDLTKKIYLDEIHITITFMNDRELYYFIMDSIPELKLRQSKKWAEFRP